MLKVTCLLLQQLICCTLFAQHFSVANEKQNIFYVGVDNPLSIAVENVSGKLLVVKTDNGIVVKNNDAYVYRGSKVGHANIILYKKVNRKLREVGKSSFRVKEIPLPVFRIGQFGSNRQISNMVIKLPQYVSAATENFDFDARFQIDSFKVCVVRQDTCIYLEKNNISNKISEDIQAIFTTIKSGDTIIFKNIFAKGPDGKSIQLEPCILFVRE